jgi:RimJ/RimL family protein N-acetyltransferase
MRRAKDSRIREHAWFADDGAIAFGLWVDGELVATCVNWTASRFRDPAVATLAEDEVALVDILTASAHRGKGYAARLLAFTGDALKQSEFRRAVCTIWHSNTPSIRIFERAGWTYTAFLVEAAVGPIRTPLRFRLTRRARD